MFDEVYAELLLQGGYSQKEYVSSVGTSSTAISLGGDRGYVAVRAGNFNEVSGKLLQKQSIGN